MEKIKLRILSSAFQLLCEIKPSYFLYSRHWFLPNTFTLKTSYSLSKSQYLQKNNIILYYSNDVWRTGVIRKRQKTYEKGLKMIEVSGSCYGNWEKKQLYDATYELTGKDSQYDYAETVMKNYVDRNLVTDAGSRTIPNLTVEGNCHRGLSVRYDARFQEFTSMFQEIYWKSGLGWDVIFDTVTNLFQFTVYQGHNYSSSQVRHVIFAEKFKNVDSIEVLDDDTNSYDTAFVYGTGVDSVRQGGISVVLNSAETGGWGCTLVQMPDYETFRTHAVLGGNLSEGRSEIFIDAADLDSLDKLYNKGYEVLNQHYSNLSMSFMYKQSGSWQYGTDFDLGDIVTVMDDEYEEDLRIIKIDEIWTDRLRINITCGNEPEDLMSKVKKRFNMNAEMRV